MVRNEAWHDEIACEGGPVMVANLADFMQWRGSEALPASMATELHYWSPFTGELPEAWQPNGPSGHQYLACSDPAGRRAALMDWIVARWPGAAVERGDGRWTAVRPDGKKLQAELSPDSEYDRAIRDLGQEGIHRFGQDASAYLWSAAPGHVRIEVAASRSLVLLAQIEYADGDDDVAQAWRHVSAAAAPVAGAGLRYRIDPGPAVLAWAPNSAGDATRPLAAIDAGPGQPGVLLDLALPASGVLVWLEPGIYASSLHYHEADRWAVSWCRLERVRDPQLDA
ncbi:hypothetical protein LQ564_00980 [Massilia sp. G4R7]|uniref:Uncharacterized protein n=1 Tax=Massilia phyllostachyos TaxID=2898585 RepID=A0ABS8PZF2_9BURK|nr:hypothetical protein [Massilia phyllostachyos]MCD2514883.1 hypothetical protein [Massilia phyllostachyos]